MMEEEPQFDKELYIKLGEPPARINDDFSMFVVVDNLPTVSGKKYERLTKVIRKKFSKCGNIKPNGINLPFPEGSKASLPYCFIEFESKEGAEKAVEMMDKFYFTKANKLRVNNLEHVFKVLEKAKTSEMKEYKPLEQKVFFGQTNLGGFLLDSFGRDQFIIRHAQETEIYWNDPLRDGKMLIYAGDDHKAQNKNWTDSYTAWSPQGSYLATYHHQGIALWGGDKFQVIGRLLHNGVKLIEFSPKEKYAITYSSLDTIIDAENDEDEEVEKKLQNTTNTQSLGTILWDVRSGTKLRGFPDGTRFKWSYDDKYFAQLTSDGIKVYSSETMKVLKKGGIRIRGIVDFEWSPTDLYISFWVPEIGELPATISMYEVPTFRVIREQRLFQVHDASMFWQKSGDYFAVLIGRYKNKGTLSSTNLEIFRMRSKGVPVDTMALDGYPIHFSWEPVGNRFGIIYEKDIGNPDIKFYSIKKTKIKEEWSVPNSKAITLHWSPIGNNVIAAGMNKFSGALSFLSVNSKICLKEEEHFMVNTVEWDSSGRFVLTAVTQPMESRSFSKNSMHNGYKFWTNLGDCYADESMIELYQICWRPRPPSLLKPSQVSKIRAKLKDKYYKQFEKEDEQALMTMKTGKEAERIRFREEFRAYRNERNAAYKSMRDIRIQLRNGALSDDENEWEIVEETIEEELSFKQEIIAGI